MRKYEALVVLRPNLEEEVRTALVEKFAGIINNDGEHLNNDDWGQKKLAYEIEKIKEGHYVIMNFMANPSLPMELERNFRIEDDVLRYVVVRVEE